MSPDIFISYAREDRALAQALADALAREGWRVWWDREIQGGTAFVEVIEQALHASRVVLVLWSEPAVASEFVRDEARRALRSGKLIPVRMAPVEPPLGFGETHTLDLLGWQGQLDAPDLQELLQQVRRRLRDTSASSGTAIGLDTALATPVPGATGHPGSAMAGKAAMSKALRLIAGGAVAALVLGGAALFLNRPRPVLVDAQGQGASRPPPERTASAANTQACAPQAQNLAWAELERGRSLLTEGNLDAARAILNKVLASEPHFARARFYLAQVLIQTQENTIAARMLTEVLQAVEGQRQCALDEGEIVKMRAWLLALAPAADEPAALAPRAPAAPDPPLATTTPQPRKSVAAGARPSPIRQVAIRSPRLALDADAQRSLQASVDTALGKDKEQRVAATTGLVLNADALSDAAPLAVLKALQILGNTSQTASTPSLEQSSAIINTLVMLQSASPATLNAHRADIESLLQKIQGQGSRTTEQASKVAALLKAAISRKPVAYIQIAHEGQRAFANAFARDLKTFGYSVPPLEVVGNKAPQEVSEVRIHGHSDRALARWLARKLSTPPAGGVRMLSLRKTTSRNDTFEIWFDAMLCAPGRPQDSACTP